MEGPARIQIDRLVIEHFRSIKHCDVTVGNVTFLVGRNGSGKSSFFDALQFIKSTLKNGLASAVSDRNGLSAILYRPSTFPAHMNFQMWFSNSCGRRGLFEIHIDVPSWTECSVRLERCQVNSEGSAPAHYSVELGKLSGSMDNLPPPPSDRLYLSAVSGFEEFRDVYKLLAGLLVSGYAPKDIHLLLLNRFPKTYSFQSEVKLLVEGDPHRRRVVEEYLRLMVPGFVRLEIESVGDREWVTFIERTGKFYIPQISDGTLYATEVMLDLFYRGLDGHTTVPVLVEEPGGSLHPWAAGVLRSALLEATKDRQVVVTTHSPDLLDSPTIPTDSLRAVYRDADGTHIEPLNETVISLLSEGACTPGELFRRGVLASDNEPEFVPFMV